jgi:hypothetical protein
MNIIDVVKNQLTSEVETKLSSLLGESQDKTRAALGAAVPGLLSVLSSLVSNSTGAEKVINALRQVDPTPPGNLGDVLSERHAQVQEKGGSLLNILLGSAALPALINVLSKFAGIAPGAGKSLLSYLAPLVLSVIAKQFTGRALTPDALSGFFSEQKANISSALPSGFSLADIPGLGGAATAARQVSTAVQQAADSGLPRWLLPLAGLALVAVLGWWFLGRPAEEPAPGPAAASPAAQVAQATVPKVIDSVKDALPEATKLTTDLGAIYTSLTDLLSGVKDVPTAEAILPKLTELPSKIDGLKSAWDKLNENAKTTVAKVTTDHLGKLRELINKVLGLAGVSDKLKPVLDSILTKLAAFEAK